MSKLILSMLASVALVTTVSAQTYEFDTPTDDRWQYPFNSLPATRPAASVFSSLGTGVASYYNFNAHDGIMIIAWDTAAQIDPNLGLSAYNIQSITVTLTNQSGAEWAVDLTPDEWYQFDFDNDGSVNGDGIPRGEPNDTDGESDDPDPGRAIELYGAGFGPTYTYLGWEETDAYVGGSHLGAARRDPFPMQYDPNGALIHVEDNIQGRWNESLGITRFTPTPWAVGVPDANYDPNNQTTPFEVTFDVDLSLFGGQAKGYFQQQLNGGRVVVTITSLADTVLGGIGDDVPSFYTKEGVNEEPGANAPILTIVLGPSGPLGDLNGDGCVDLTDLGTLLGHYGQSPASPEEGDLDDNDTVDLTDLGILLGNYGEGNC